MDARLTPSGRSAAAVLLACAAVLQTLIALRTPVGIIIDDAVYLLLARALGHGSYVLPDGFAQPVTSFWPGMPLLWALPVRLIEPHWALARIPALLCSWLALGLTWRLASKMLPAAEVAAAVVLVALSPVFLLAAGVSASDMPFLAACLAAFCALSEDRRPGWLEAATALACLIRPEGILLAFCLALAVGWRAGSRRAAAFLAVCLAPAAAWLLRNHLLAGTTSDYWTQLSSQMSLLADPSYQLEHAGRLVGVFFGGGLLGLPLPAPAALVVGLLVLFAAGAGAVGLLRRGRDPRVLAMAAFAVGVFCLHLLWQQIFDRYLLPLLPLIWIFALSAARDLRPERRRPALKAAAALLLGLLLWRDAAALSALPATGAQPWPETMAWIRDNTAPAARLQSFYAPNVMLWTGRSAVASFRGVSLRDHWLAKCLYNGIEYVVVEEDASRWEHMPGAWQAEVYRLGAWAASSPYVAAVFRSPADRTIVYRIRHPHPERFLKAWKLFGEAMLLSREHGPVRTKLLEALALEPELECARAALLGGSRYPTTLYY